jgi:phage tail sheath gpL-like
MVTLGSTKLSGVQTTVDSASSTGVNVSAAAQVGIVGQADLANGTANANEVHEVTTPVKAREKFGSGSMLAENIVDAITEGAYPVYAVAPERKSTMGEDLSGLSQKDGTLSNGPVTEDASEITFTINGTSMTTVITYSDPTTQTPGTDEVYVNPVTQEFNIDGNATVGNAGDDVDYKHFDYPTATEALYSAQSERLDLVGVLNENSAVVTDALSEAEVYDDRHEFTSVVAGAAARIADTSTFTNSHDSSRLQLLYPSRNADNESIIGAYLGLRAALGINNSPIWKRLQTQNDLAVTLSKVEQENLYDEKVVPVADESRGARIVEDLTCVDDNNSDEQAMSQLLHRLIVDYVTERAHEASERFIGELHTPAARNALRSIMVREMKALLDLNAITAFTINVEKVDAMTASMDVGIDTVDPLRNILTTITAGDVVNGSGATA